MAWVDRSSIRRRRVAVIATGVFREVLLPSRYLRVKEGKAGTRMAGISICRTAPERLYLTQSL
jgi:hypothetical protein